MKCCELCTLKNL